MTILVALFVFCFFIGIIVYITMGAVACTAAGCAASLYTIFGSTYFGSIYFLLERYRDLDAAIISGSLAVVTGILGWKLLNYTQRRRVSTYWLHLFSLTAWCSLIVVPFAVYLNPSDEIATFGGSLLLFALYVLWRSHRRSQLERARVYDRFQQLPNI